MDIHRKGLELLMSQMCPPTINNVPLPQLLMAATTAASLPDFGASPSVAISLQKDIYVSFKKASPRLLLASPASTKAYTANIAGVKITLFDVYHSKARLEGKY
jgi:hypothetical protein